MLYTTLHPKDFLRLFGDFYNIEKRELNINGTIVDLEHYYNQEINEEDIFIVEPTFGQMCLIRLLLKDNLNPKIITVIKNDHKDFEYFSNFSCITTAFNLIENINHPPRNMIDIMKDNGFYNKLVNVEAEKQKKLLYIDELIKKGIGKDFDELLTYSNQELFDLEMSHLSTKNK